MTTSSNGTESNTDSQIPANMPKPTPTAEPTGNTDEFGYDNPTPPVKADEPPVVKDEPPKDEPAKGDEPPKKVEKTVTGYDDEDEDEPAKKDETPPKKEDKKDEPGDQTDEEKIKASIAEAVKSLGDGYNKEAIVKLALENKMTKDQVEAYVKFQAAEDEKALKAHEQRVKEQRKQWKEELKTDKEFAGEKGDQFDKSVLKVNQLLEKMPNTKKVLTDKGGMLPPYLMKDFLALAKALNPTQKFEGGEPPAPAEEPKNWMDEFYT